MLYADEIKKMTYIGTLKEQEPFSRYEVEFAGDYLPDTIAFRANTQARKDGVNSHFEIYSNNNICPHFKFYPEGDGKNSLALTVTDNSSKILFTTEISLFDDEVETLTAAAAETVKRKLYEAYKQEWVEENVTAAMEEEAENEYEELSEDYASFNDYIEENGYQGSLYVCYEEFLDCEYQDEDWIKSHLNSEQAKVLWENDVNFPFDKVDGIEWNDGKEVFVYSKSQKQAGFPDKD